MLAADCDVAQPFIASRVGEVLYEDWEQVELQGEGGRLPISVIDFEANGLDPHARWWLDVHSDPTSSYSGALRLYLNKDDADLVRAAERAADPSPVQKRLLEWLHVDVARQLIELVLQPDWMETYPEFEGDPDSLGAAIASLTSILFDGRSLEAVAALRSADPGRFAARLQGALRRTPQLET
ncbi:hypothetical protein ACWDO6_02350 [Streptomyces sp. NPDC003674]